MEREKICEDYDTLEDYVPNEDESEIVEGFTHMLVDQKIQNSFDEFIQLLKEDNECLSIFVEKYYYAMKSNKYNTSPVFPSDYKYISDLMDERKEVTMEMILDEFNYYAPGFEDEKRKLADIVWRYYLVEKTKPICYASNVFEDTIKDNRVKKFSDITKYVLCEVFWEFQ